MRTCSPGLLEVSSIITSYLVRAGMRNGIKSNVKSVKRQTVKDAISRERRTMKTHGDTGARTNQRLPTRTAMMTQRESSGYIRLVAQDPQNKQEAITGENCMYIR